MEKMTNVKALAFILENVKDLPVDVTEKVKAMKASYEKKAENKKPTATQKENQSYKDEILATLEVLNKPSTVTDIQNASASLKAISNQRVSALLKLLKDDGLVVKTVDKKKSYFALAETPSDDDTDGVADNTEPADVE